MHFLERQTKVIGNVRFIGCTSWTDFAGIGNQSRAMLDVRSVVNDYRHIRVEPGFSQLTAAHTRRYAEQARAWLRAEVAKPLNGLTVVITHHPPLMRFVPEISGYPHLRAADGNEWTEFLNMPVDLWVFGHT